MTPTLRTPPLQEVPTGAREIDDAQVRIISWNVKKGEYVHDACAWLAAQRPDVVLWQELQPGHHDMVARALNMTGYYAARRPGSNNDNAIFVKETGALQFAQEHRQDWAPWHAPCNITVQQRGPEGQLGARSLALVSLHLCYWSSAVRQIEADWVTTLAKPGWLALIAGDWNSLPVETPPIDWDRVQDKAFTTNRTYLCSCTAGRHTDDRPDRTLTAAGYTDAARYAAHELHHHPHNALRGTAGYGPDKALQGGELRIDRVLVSNELTPAVRSLVTGSLSTTEDAWLDTVSDHRPLTLDLDAPTLWRLMSGPPA